MSTEGKAADALSWSERATVGGYKFGSLAARAVPTPTMPIVSRSMGAMFKLAMRGRRDIVERNLRRVDPSLSGPALREAVRNSFESYARYYLESFRLPTMKPDEVVDGFDVQGFEHVAAGLQAGKGVILALPHLGGWEWAGRWLIEQHRVRMTVIVEELQPRELFEWFADLRAALGMNVVPLGPSAGAEVSKALRANEVVCLLSDGDIDRRGIEVSFFGESTTLPAGPATIAARSGAALLPCAVYFTETAHGHLGVVRPPIDCTRSGDGMRADAARLTQVLANELEHLIRAAPEQWHMFQPNWPSDPGY